MYIRNIGDDSGLGCSGTITEMTYKAAPTVLRTAELRSNRSRWLLLYENSDRN